MVNKHYIHYYVLAYIKCCNANIPLYTVIICDLSSLNQNSHLSRLNLKSRVAPLYVRPTRHYRQTQVCNATQRNAAHRYVMYNKPSRPKLHSDVITFRLLVHLFVYIYKVSSNVTVIACIVTIFDNDWSWTKTARAEWPGDRQERTGNRTIEASRELNIDFRGRSGLRRRHYDIGYILFPILYIISYILTLHKSSLQTSAHYVLQLCITSVTYL